MESRITDTETLKQLAEEARFIESLMDLDGTNYNTIVSNDILEEKKEYIENKELEDKLEVEEDIDLVLNRNGEYITFHEDLVYIEHRGYYVEEEGSYWLEFQKIDEDYDRVVQVIDNYGNEIDISDDFKDIIFTDDPINFLNKESAIANGYEFIDNIWKKKIVIITNEIDKTKLGFYNDLEYSLNQFYPNNWWFQENKYTFDNTIPERIPYLNYFRNYPYVLIIKFPYIKITNSSNQEHIIEDLYVLLGFLPNGKTTSVMYGFRGIITNIEHNNDYYHSHLGNHNIFDIGTFCLGSGDLVQILHKMYTNTFNKILFCTFLANLKVYVEWESIEGTPYRQINNIINKSILTIHTNINNNELKVILENNYLNSNNTNLFIEYNSNSNLLDINFKKLEINLSEFISNNENYRRTFIFVYKDEELDQYFTISDSTNKEVNYNKSLCKLGDKDIFIQVKEIQNKNTNFKKVLHPNLTYYAKKYLTRRINEYYFQEN